MKHLGLSQDRQYLTLVVPDQTPLRAAAKAIRGYHFEGRHDGLAVFSFPVAPDVAALIVEAFTPCVADDSKEAVARLVALNTQLDAAVGAKQNAQVLSFDAELSTTPMAHQVAAMNFAMARFDAGAKGCGLLMEQGTGKSLVAIGLANALFRRGAVQWAMVVAPNSLKGTWGGADGEIRRHSAAPADVLIPTGTRSVRLRQAVAFLQHQAAELPWTITNYENFALSPRTNKSARELVDGWEELARGCPGLLIVDESTMVKNGRSRRTQVLTRLAVYFRYVLILTGTPVTSSPLDVFSQFEVMERGCLGYQTFLAFDHAYAIRQRRRFGSGRLFEEVVGYRDLDDLEGRVARVSYRARADECLDLPDVVTKRIPVALSPAQARAIAGLKDDMMAELEDGQAIDGRNILTRYLRMAQVIGGYVGVLGEDGQPTRQVHAFDPNPKLNALEEYLELLLDDPTQKAVVFAQYRAEIANIRTIAVEHRWKPVTFYGGTPLDEREAGLVRFRRDPKTRLFVAQYQTGSKGLTLVEAANVVFYSLTFSLEDFLQARKRVHRIGQVNTVTEAYLLGQVQGRRGPRPTLDHLILNSLQQKQNFADRVTGDHARKALEAL